MNIEVFYEFCTAILNQGYVDIIGINNQIDIAFLDYYLATKAAVPFLDRLNKLPETTKQGQTRIKHPYMPSKEHLMVHRIILKPVLSAFNHANMVSSEKKGSLNGPLYSYWHYKLRKKGYKCLSDFWNPDNDGYAKSGSRCALSSFKKWLGTNDAEILREKITDMTFVEIDHDEKGEPTDAFIHPEIMARFFVHIEPELIYDTPMFIEAYRSTDEPVISTYLFTIHAKTLKSPYNQYMVAFTNYRFSIEYDTLQIQPTDNSVFQIIVTAPSYDKVYQYMLGRMEQFSTNDYISFDKSGIFIRFHETIAHKGRDLPSSDPNYVSEDTMLQPFFNLFEQLNEDGILIIN